MAELFLHVTNVILPVLICAAIGYGLARFKVPFDNKMVNGVVANVGYPTLIISHLSGAHVPISAFLDMMLAAVAVLACFCALAFVFLKIMGLNTRAFLSPLMHANVGNVGLPIALLAFGEAGMAYAMAFVVVVVVSIFTVGMAVTMGRFSIRSLLTSPIIYAVIFTLVLMATNTALPKPIDAAFTILGGLAIPLMLLTLGYTLATLKVSALWRATYLSLFHIVMGGAVAWVLLQVFGFTGTERGVFILMCLMPVSVATYLFVDQHVHDLAHEVAGLIMVSTLLTIVVMTLALTFWI